MKQASFHILLRSAGGSFGKQVRRWLCSRAASNSLSFEGISGLRGASKGSSSKVGVCVGSAARAGSHFFGLAEDEGRGEGKVDRMRPTSS
jgi:hypothetical protein